MIDPEPVTLGAAAAAVLAALKPPGGEPRAAELPFGRPADHPLVRAVLTRFPGSQIVSIRTANR